MLRTLRTILTLAVTALGVAVVLAAVLTDPDTDFSQRLTMVLLGVVLLEAAAWKRNNPFLPSERRFHDLRAEAELFILMIRRLNEAALAEVREQPREPPHDRDSVLREMHASVDRMGAVAGRLTEAD